MGAAPAPVPGQSGQTSATGGIPSPIAKPIVSTPIPSPASAPLPATPTPPSPITPAAPVAPATPAAPTPPSPLKPIAGSTPTPPTPPAPAPAPGAPAKPSTGGPTPPAKPPVAGAATPPAKGPVFAKAGGFPIKKYLPFIVGGFVLLILVIFLIGRFASRSSTTSTGTTPAKTGTTGTTKAPAKQTTISYWSLWEPCSTLEPVFAKFEQANPGVLVSCQQQSPKDYRERLQTAIAGGQGPDVFRFHASWVPMLKNELSAMPSSVMSPSEYKQTFYPIAVTQLTSNGQLVGVPLMYDQLALYYDKDALSTAGEQPPQTWAQLRELAVKLTVNSESGMERGGLAIGTADNVDHFSDILGLLILQNGGNPAQPTQQATMDALTFYTNFAKTDKVWSSDLPNSTAAFARSQAAMMFAPSWRYHEIKALNPNINIGVAPVPRLGDQPVGWATYWAEGVSAQSKSKNESWALLKYLSSKEGQQLWHAEQAKTRPFGEVYGRQDLATSLQSDGEMGAFIQNASAAKNWYLNSWTYDNGLNDQITKYYVDAINSMIDGKQAKDVTATVSQGVNQVLRQYGLATPTQPAAAE
jgi:multiple sugar transport system substrate-binding protein